MRAFALDTFGSAGSIRDVPTPEPGSGQIRVRLASASVNPVDNMVTQGFFKDMMEHRFPLISGMDGSGIVDAVGEGVEGWSEGDQVFGAVGTGVFGAGTLAEYAAMASGTVARRPPSLDHAAAAAIPIAGITALTMADELDLRPDVTVLIIGATGGVGSYLVQVAARRGARVLAVCSGRNVDYARSMGAGDVIDYERADVVDAVRSRHPDGIDAIADLVGDREDLARLADQLRPGGRVASAVGAVDVEALAGRGFTGINVQTMVTTESLTEMAGLLDAGDIKNPEIRKFALEDTADALAAIATRHTRGKLVIDIASL